MGTRLISCSLLERFVQLILKIFLNVIAALQKRFLRVQWMNKAVLRMGCNICLATSLAMANSHRMMKCVCSIEIILQCTLKYCATVLIGAPCTSIIMVKLYCS